MVNFEIDFEAYEQEIKSEIVQLIQSLGELVLSEEGFEGDYEISLSFMDDEQIRALNREYRDKDCSTDVLSFPMLDDEMEEFELDDSIPILLGDIMISVPTAIRQAEEYNHSLKREILFLVCHSILHLLGYDHIDEAERVFMEEKQEYYLKKLGVTRSA